MENSVSDVRAVNGDLDKRYNQSLDWFLNSSYYTANIPITFLYVNEANHLESMGLPWQESRINFKFSKDYKQGDKVIIYYANEVYMSDPSTSIFRNEKRRLEKFLEEYNVPLKDIVFIGNIFEFNKGHTQLGLDLGLKSSQILMIDYYELQTYFFHKVLGSTYNKSFNPNASKGLKYLFGKIDKPIRIITMYELWKRDLLKNGVTGCLIDYEDIDSLAEQVSEEYSRWLKKSVNKNDIANMLKECYGSPDNVKYYYFTLPNTRHREAQKLFNEINQMPRNLFNKINHCPSYPYDHQILFTDSKVSLIPETYYYFNHTSFITEKTYKTIYNHHPFTILGTPGILKELRMRGYKTFEGICDEMYDLCLNDRKRVELVINATKELLDSTEHNEIDAITKHNFAQLEQNSLATVDDLNRVILNNFS